MIGKISSLDCKWNRTIPLHRINKFLAKVFNKNCSYYWNAMNRTMWSRTLASPFHPINQLVDLHLEMDLIIVKFALSCQILWESKKQMFQLLPFHLSLVFFGYSVQCWSNILIQSSLKGICQNCHDYAKETAIESISKWNLWP